MEEVIIRLMPFPYFSDVDIAWIDYYHSDGNNNEYNIDTDTGETAWADVSKINIS